MTQDAVRRKDQVSDIVRHTGMQRRTGSRDMALGDNEGRGEVSGSTGDIFEGIREFI